MFDTKKLVASLKTRVKALEDQAVKDANTVSDRFKIVEQTIEAAVKADAPEVAADVAKIAADLEDAVTRIATLEALVKEQGAQLVALTAKAPAKRAAAKKTTTDAATATVEAPAAEVVTPA